MASTQAAGQPATDPAVAARATEAEDRQINSIINAMIADTDDEVFRDALGDESLDNDGDHSLEEMHEPVIDEVEDADDEADGEAEIDASADVSEDESEGETDEELDAQPGARSDVQPDAQGDRSHFVPSSRLREETEKRTAAEQREAALQARLGTLEALVTRIAQAPQSQAQPQPQPQADPEPDMFGEPQKWAAWNRQQAVKEATETMRREQRAEHNSRVERNFAQAAQGDRSWEFGPMYQTLMSLDNRDPRARALVEHIFYSPDPAGAMFNWWDQTYGPQFRAHTAHQALSRLPQELRDQVFEQLTPQEQREVNRQNAQTPRGRQAARGQQQPRQEFRPAQALPSLNSAQGSNVHRQADPELYNNSEESVFSFATR